MKNIIITLLVIIVGVSALIFVMKPETAENGANINNATNNGELSAEEEFFDFSTISMAKGKVSHMFKIKNSSTEPVVIKKMYTSCMCTEAMLLKGGKKYGPYGMPGHSFVPLLNQTINPGEEAEVEAVFDPAAHGPAGVGKIERVVTLEGKSGKLFEFGFSATVTP